MSTSQRLFFASSGLNFLSSFTIARAPATGSSSGSGGAMSTRCSSSRVRCRCFRNRMPRPAPSAAPSISPGMSAITKLLSGPTDDHAELRVQRRERIVGDFRPRRRHGADQRGLAGVRQAEQADVGEQAELHAQAPRFARQSRAALARRAVGRALEALVAPAALAALRDQQRLARGRQVAERLARVVIEARPCRPASARRGRRRRGRCSPGRRPAARSARGTCADAVVDERIDAVLGAQPHAAAEAAVAAVRAAERHEFFAAESRWRRARRGRRRR